MTFFGWGVGEGEVDRNVFGDGRVMGSRIIFLKMRTIRKVSQCWDPVQYERVYLAKRNTSS